MNLELICIPRNKVLLCRLRFTRVLNAWKCRKKTVLPAAGWYSPTPRHKAVDILRYIFVFLHSLFSFLSVCACVRAIKKSFKKQEAQCLSIQIGLNLELSPLLINRFPFLTRPLVPFT